MDNVVVETLFGLLGGLALFLFGMNMMSEGLQKVAGQKMKKILGMLTCNRVVGCIAGALVTAVLQSSSATTVMVIGFVSAGLMTLPQGISVIFGANIGTTMTAQLLAFKISDYIWIIVFVGFIMWFVCKNRTLKYTGQTILAFGLLFVGIETMGDVMKPLASSDVFLNMIEYVKNIPALGICVGALMTLVVQSSSATIAVLQNLASQPAADGVSSVIGIKGAIPVLLGDNIGTTITALLACIGQSRDAKRVAVSHATFNVIGALVFVWFVPLLAMWVQFLSPGNEVDVISRQIANAHTTYNIINTLIWLPLLNVMVKIVCFIVPDKGDEDKKMVQLDHKIVDQPVFAIKMLREQIEKYLGWVNDELVQLRDMIGAKSTKATASMTEQTTMIENCGEELMNYMVELYSAGSLTEAQASEVSELMLVTDSVGRINTRCADCAAVYEDKLNQRKQFSDDAVKDLTESVQMLIDMYDEVVRYLEVGTPEDEATLEKDRRQVIKRQSKIRKRHFKRLSNKECPAANKVPYEEMLLCFERISNECFNLIEHDADLQVLRRPETAAAATGKGSELPAADAAKADDVKKDEKSDKKDEKKSDKKDVKK